MTQRVVNYTYGTGNPVLPDGSIDVRDGIDNLQSFDIFMNASEDTYNQRDGEIVPTVAGVIRSTGFKPGTGDFTTGFTVMPGYRNLVWYDPVSHNWYSYLGVIPSPSGHHVAPGTNPVGSADWMLQYNYNFQQTGAGAVNRNSQDKMREVVSAPDFGSGIAAFSAAKVELGADPVLIPRGTFDIGANAPDFEVKGPGLIMANGVSSGGADLSYNPARESIFYTPKTYQREEQGINYPPPRGAGFERSSYNTVFAPGSKLQDQNKTIRYTVAFGNLIGSAPLSWGYIDAFGGNTLAYAGNVERTTAVGSESLIWFGAPDQEWLRTYKHDWWRKPQDNPYEPGEPGWDANGLETLFPGIGARIDAFSGYAVDSTKAGFTSTLGRNAGNRIVAGVRNNFHGYQCAWQMFAGSYNVAYGSLALQNVVFGSYLTAIGDHAGRDCLDSTNAFFGGYGAGRTVQKATGSVFIGDRTADNVINAERAVIIGQLAGAGHPTSLSDKLVISNDKSTVKLPLMSGDFVNLRAGVSIQPESIRTKWHVRAAGSGSVLTPDNGLLVEGANAAAITIETNNTGFGNLNFADPEGIAVGGLTYGHGSNSLQLKAGGAERWRLRSDGGFHPAVDNAYSLGISSNRASVIFAGTGTINTSDAREKTAPLPITDAMMDAIDSVDIVLYQWLSSIAEKGSDNARWHFGAMAQAVRDAFAAQGLDGRGYGLICYDEWEDGYEERAAEYEEVPAVTQEVDGEMVEITPAHQRLVKEAYKVQTVVAGNRWGLRPDQCMWLLAAAARRRAERAESRLSKIEERLTMAGL